MLYLIAAWAEILFFYKAHIPRAEKWFELILVNGAVEKRILMLWLAINIIYFTEKCDYHYENLLSPKDVIKRNIFQCKIYVNMKVMHEKKSLIKPLWRKYIFSLQNLLKKDVRKTCNRWCLLFNNVCYVYTRILHFLHARIQNDHWNSSR